MALDKEKLLQLLKREEGPKLDFKLRLSLSTESEKKELTKDVIAISNSRGGRGHIIFGIEDKSKRIVGIEPGDFKEEQIQQVIYNRSDPPVPVSIDLIQLDGVFVAVLSIYRSTQKPHQMIQNGSFYVRRGSTTDTARRSEIANLFQENGLMTYETVILHKAGIAELDFTLIREYFKNLDVVSESPNEILLEAMGIIGQKVEAEGFHPTIGGMLLFGKNPSLFLPHVYVKVIYRDDARCFYGNILNMLDCATEYITDAVKSSGCTVPEDSKEHKCYPFGAVSEALANALVHRDYLDISRGITVTITDRNIEVSNPGALIAGNNVYRFMKENNPDRRNPWLYQRLLSLDTQKRFLKSGIGLHRIENAFRGIGKVKFLNIGERNLFKVILPR